jgi:virginiamycin B lyase
MKGVMVQFRRLLLVAFVAVVAFPVDLAAQSTPTADAATPPEECLVVDEFPVRAGDAPHDVAPAADGRVWYTAQGAAALGLLDPASGEIERFPLGAGSAPHGVITGPDGAGWVTDGGLNAIVRVDPATGEVETFPLPGENANLNTATFDGDGLLWFTGQAGVVGWLDPATGELAVSPAPEGLGPYGITTTPSGEVYFVSLAGSYLGRIEVAADDNARTVSIQVIEPPTRRQGARRVWSDSTGNLWISEWQAGQVGRFDPASGEWTEWPLPGDAAQAYAVYVDERDDVWLSDFGSDSLVRFDPDTEEFVSLPLPDAGGNVRQIHGRPGEVWAPESAADTLLRITSSCEGGA